MEKRVLACTVVLMFLVLGCASRVETSEPIAEKPVVPQSPVQSERQAVPQASPAVNEPTAKPQTPPEPPKQGKIQFTSKVQGATQEPPAQFAMASSGAIDYSIDGTKVTGTGQARIGVKVVSDIAVAKCTGQKDVGVNFKIAGTYDSKKNAIRFKSININPSNVVLKLVCPSQYSGILQYDLTVPFLLFGEAEGGVELPLKPDVEVTRQITHPVPDWGIQVVAPWKFLIRFPEFDFDIDVDPPVVTIIQGETATAYVTPRALKGSGTLDLTVTQFAKLRAYFGTNPVNAPGPSSGFVVETFCDSPPGEYLYTVQGETKGTFKTSVDSVKVIVKENKHCEGKESKTWPAISGG